jgi:hypothetical protein
MSWDDGLNFSFAAPKTQPIGIVAGDQTTSHCVSGFIQLSASYV